MYFKGTTKFDVLWCWASAKDRFHRYIRYSCVYT